ncbi:MAG: hypothetical protein LC802_06980 [Acidobacteria bacterium]|nr:hypothetical protein [Acidobacteriota bacterium]
MKETKTEASGFAPPLGDMNAEDFRRYGHEIIDRLGDYLSHMERYPVLAQVKPGELRSQLPSSPPEQGEPMDEILADVARPPRPSLKRSRSLGSAR